MLSPAEIDTLTMVYCAIARGRSAEICRAFGIRTMPQLTTFALMIGRLGGGTSETVNRIDWLLACHKRGMPRRSLAQLAGCSQSQMSSFIGVLRRLGVRVPASPNLRNSGNRIFK